MSYNQTCSIKSTEYNYLLVDACRKLKGKWDGANSEWIFDKKYSKKIKELNDFYNSEKVEIEVTLSDNKKYLSVDFEIMIMGYPLIKKHIYNQEFSLAKEVYIQQGNIKFAPDTRHKFREGDFLMQLSLDIKLKTKLPRAVIDKYCSAPKEERFFDIKIIY